MAIASATVGGAVRLGKREPVPTPFDQIGIGDVRWPEGRKVNNASLDQPLGPLKRHGSGQDYGAGKLLTELG